jgi:hypothetical protein
MVFKDFISKNLPIKREDDRHPLSKLQQDMNRVFDSFFDDLHLASFQDRNLWNAHMDLSIETFSCPVKWCPRM